jgi:hypothetical protein
MPLGAGYAPGDMPEWMAAFNMQLMAAEQAMDIAEAEIEADLQDLENHMQGIEHDVGGGDSGTLLWAENAVQPTQSDSDEDSLHDEQFAAAIMSDEPGMAFGLTSNFAKVLFLRRLMEKGDGNLQWSVQQLASLCQMHDKSCEREFKDELRRQGVIERMVVTLAEAERHVERCVSFCPWILHVVLLADAYSSLTLLNDNAAISLRVACVNASLMLWRGAYTTIARTPYSQLSSGS